jgi:hypothetical protein
MGVRQLLKLPSWVLLLILIIGLSYLARGLITLNRAAPLGQSANHPEIADQQTKPTTNSSEEKSIQLTPADKFALNLQRKFDANGYDISVYVVDKTLTLKSELFKDGAARESEVNELLQDPKTLCGLKIWYVKVGYSKGVLSSDVMKSVSLGCPEEKIEHTQEMASERQKIAADLNGEGMQVSVNDTTLVVDSDFFSDRKLRSRFIQRIVSPDEEMRKFCWLAFTKIELRYRNLAVQTVPVVCK